MRPVQQLLTIAVQPNLARTRQAGFQAYSNVFRNRSARCFPAWKFLNQYQTATWHLAYSETVLGNIEVYSGDASKLA